MNPTDPNIIYYGPHECAVCFNEIIGPRPSVMIVKVSREQGGAEFDYPSGLIYPNTIWVPHIHCHTEPPAISRPSFTAEELEQRATQFREANLASEKAGLWPSRGLIRDADMLHFAAQCVRDRVEDKRALATAQLQLDHVTRTLEQLLATLRDVKFLENKC